MVPRVICWDFMDLYVYIIHCYAISPVSYSITTDVIYIISKRPLHIQVVWMRNKNELYKWMWANVNQAM